MGDTTDMILEGTLCQICGVYLGEGDGFPVTCNSCGGDAEEENELEDNNEDNKNA